MKIGFDLRWIRSAQIDGISRYAINLVAHLLQTDHTHEYVLVGDPRLIANCLPGATAPQVTLAAIPQPVLSVADLLTAPREIARLQVDLWHVPHYLTSPARGRCQKILTVFDLIPFLFPAALSKSRTFWRWFYKTTIPARLMLRSADLVITSSEHTKRDLMRLLRVPEDRIRVVWCGIERRFQPLSDVPAAFRQQYRLPPRFLLCVGRQDPYKGLEYLVNAYALLPGELQRAYQVVIAGKTDDRYIGAVHRAIERAGLQAAFHFLDYVPDEDLPRLYAAATLLVHPSLYEGFGLPPLEAMACGTPVVYADTSSLTELLGAAGCAVAPANAAALAQGMTKLLTDADVRRTFSARGLIHVQRYAWPAVAQAMLRLYDSLERHLKS